MVTRWSQREIFLMHNDLIEKARKLDVLMQSECGYGALSQENLDLLAEQFEKLSLDTAANVTRERFASDKSTMNRIDPLITALNTLADFVRADDRAARRVLRNLNYQPVSEEFDHTATFSDWLNFAPAMLKAAKQAKNDLNDPNDIDLEEALISLHPKPSGSHGWETELKGKLFVELYYRMYPDGEIGGNRGTEKNVLVGPLYSFVASCMEIVGYMRPTSNSIRKAREKVGLSE